MSLCILLKLCANFSCNSWLVNALRFLSDNVARKCWLCRAVFFGWYGFFGSRIEFLFFDLYFLRSFLERGGSRGERLSKVLYNFSSNSPLGSSLIGGSFARRTGFLPGLLEALPGLRSQDDFCIFLYTLYIPDIFYYKK